MDIISATNKINFGYYEKLFWHFGFGNDHLLREAISANIYITHNKKFQILTQSLINFEFDASFEFFDKA